MRHYIFLMLLVISAAGFAQIDSFRDQIAEVDFKSVNAEISIFPSEEKVTGTVEYNFDVLKESDSIFINAKNMKFEQVSLNGKPVTFFNDKNRIWLISDFKPSEGNVLKFSYSATPEQAMYFINWNSPEGKNINRQVWTQGQGKNNSNWLPSFDDTREKTVFDLKLNFKSGYEVIANGRLKDTKPLNDSIVQWTYDMEKPMSSYLVAVAAGKFEKQQFMSDSGIPLSLYFDPGEKDKVEPTYRYSKEIFDFFEQEIGVPYPWQNYNQIPVQDFLYAGMENTGTTIFSNSLVVDSIAFKDRNYVNVNAHELAHQWFGNLITETNGEDHWLHEGFATYYALLAEKKLFGEDYFYWKLFQSAEQLKELSDVGKGQSLLNPGGSSLTYYQKGAWALHILKEIVGEQDFNQGIKNYLEKYSYNNVTTDDFLSEMEKASGKDLRVFKEDWLQQSAFQGTEALGSLQKSEFITNYMEIAGMREAPFSRKKEILRSALDFPVNDYIGQEVVYQLKGESGPEAIQLYKKAFDTGNLYIRQAISMSLDPVPKELKGDFESLLNDESYLTIENALLKLWLQFPEEAGKYLEKTKSLEGFSNKNIRMLWLTLKLVSPEGTSAENEKFYNELSSYTRKYYPFEVRENAFGYLYQIDALSDKNLLDLIDGTQHHTYSFRNFSRKLLDKLLEEEKFRLRIDSVRENLKAQELEYLNTKI